MTRANPSAPRRGARVRRLLRRIVLVVVAALLVAAAAGQAVRARTAAAHPAPGRLVDVGGYRLHLDCRGAPTGPTVVFDAGQGDFSLSYRPLLEELSRTGRACAYDRAGLGWSDVSPHPRTAERVVAELRTLLENAGEAGPYLLVGHSLGALHVRLYAYRYPDEVAGLVLLDGAHEDQFATVPDLFRSTIRIMPVLYAARRVAVATGLPALLGRAGAYVPASMPRALADEHRALAASSPKLVATAARELAALPETHAQLRAARAAGLGDIPLIALSHDVCNGCGMLDPEQLEAYERNWRANQAAVAAQSARGRWAIAPGSAHEVHLDRPDLTLDAIRDVLDASPSRTPAASEKGASA